MAGSCEEFECVFWVSFSFCFELCGFVLCGFVLCGFDGCNPVAQGPLRCFPFLCFPSSLDSFWAEGRRSTAPC